VVASASHDQTVRLWNASTGEETQKLAGHDNVVTAVAFSPDGQVVASASRDRTVRLWNASTGEETQKLAGHDYMVTAVAFSPDGQVVASASRDQTVRLWNASTAEEIYRFDDVRRAEELKFADSGRALSTNAGTFDVSQYITPFPTRSTGAVTVVPQLILGDQWVRYGDYGFFWLPHEYRGSCSAVLQNMLVIGQASGAVSFLEFRDIERVEVLRSQNAFKG